MKSRVLVAVCALMFNLWVAFPANAVLIEGLAQSDFSTAVIVESFQGAFVATTQHDFLNGMSFQSLENQNSGINTSGTYGMGTEPNPDGGVDGTTDGYFGLGPAGQDIEFSFSVPVFRFGFYGAEAVESIDPCPPLSSCNFNDGVMAVDFYDVSDSLIASVSFSTAGIFAWDQFHGFASTVQIGRVVVVDSGHMILDGIHFDPQPIPLPSAVWMFVTGLLGLIGAGRCKAVSRLSNGLFPAIEGVSYMDRFDILCRRLMQKNLYTAASVIQSPRSAIKDGSYSDVSRDTSIKAFLASLASHVETIAAIESD